MDEPTAPVDRQVVERPVAVGGTAPSLRRAVLVAFVVGLVLGGLATWAVLGADGEGAGDGDGDGATVPSAQELAAAIGPLPRPSDCPLPLDDLDLLPNAARDYRGGVHEGVDFICGELGHDATTPLPGRVLIANRSHTEPEPEERLEILAQAKELGDTPRWTLELLYGRFVVVDHGVIEGAGHVVSVYAHLEEIDPAIRPGGEVAAGDRIGEIGRSGTQSAGTGADEPGALHLHWELRIDDRFLGIGESPDDVVAAYRTLFSA
jgi:hypothetical protein